MLLYKYLDRQPAGLSNDHLISSTVAVTDTQLAHLANVTSDIQTQLNDKISSQWTATSLGIQYGSNVGIKNHDPIAPLTLGSSDTALIPDSDGFIVIARKSAAGNLILNGAKFWL